MSKSMKRLALITVLAMGCGSAPTGAPTAGPGAPDWRRGVTPPELADYVVVVGEGDSESAARTASEQALERRIWGEGPLPQGPTVPHADLVEKTDATGTHAVLLAVAKPVLGRLMQARIDVIGYVADDPKAPFGPRLATAMANMAKGRDKQRACAWVTTCSSDEGAAMRAALVQRLAEVEITPKIPSVPFRRGVGPLQPLTVNCHMKGQPAAAAYGVKLRALDGPAPLGGAVSTASDGSARFDLAGITSTSVRVVLDAPELADVPSPELTVPLREISSSSARVSVQLELTTDDNRAAPEPAMKAFIAAIHGQGMAKPEPLSPRFSSILSSPRQTEFALRDIAEVADGAVDIIVVGSIQTAFANRMGARSVWHEAKGKIAVYDVWTATLIAEHSGATQQVGIGDAAAQSKAIAELAKLLAADLKNDIVGLSAGGAVATSGSR